MYPSLFDFLKDVFGIEISGLRFINTFGFFVALAFFSAFYIARKQLQYKEKVYALKPSIVTKWIGKKVSYISVFYYLFFGFILGYKIIGIFSATALSSTEYLFSSQGSWLGGILIGGFFGYVNFREQKKNELPEPKEQVTYIPAHGQMENIFLIALVAGLLGAKIFHNLEHWDTFVEHPIQSLFSFSGLTFYGGLICATLSIWVYLKKRNLDIWIFSDAISVGVLMAYGVGRFGCHFSGDGDWGIVNLSPNPVSFLPDWWWAYNYPNNVLGEVLTQPVFPTPLYEAVTCVILALVLGKVSKKIMAPGVTFSIYLMVVALERLLIEEIRVNPKYSFGLTQAELISIILFLLGAVLMYVHLTRYKKKANNNV